MTFRTAALAAAVSLGVSGAWAQVPVYYSQGSSTTNGTGQQPALGIVPMCSIDINGYAVPCKAGTQPPLSYLNASGVLVNVTPSTPLPISPAAYATDTITATPVSITAAISTPLIGSNKSRKYLQICGPIATGSSWELGYGTGTDGATVVTASPTSSVPFGPAGISLCARWGPGDGIPTNAISVFASISGTFQVEEGN